MKKLLVKSALLLGFAATTSAATIQFDLMGKGGVGLSSTNENSGVGGVPGFGGEVGPGITFDDVTNIPTLNVHTVTNPGDEIRGNRVAGPEPVSLGLLFVTPALVLLRRRRLSPVP